MKLHRDQVVKLVRLVELTRNDEIDCDEFLQRAAAGIESLAKAGAATPEDEALAHHLSICVECCEEFDEVLRLYREGL